jgi:FkbM family methyltransferase
MTGSRASAGAEPGTGPAQNSYPVTEIAIWAHQHPPAGVLSRLRRFLFRLTDYCRILGVRQGLHWFAMKALSRIPIPGTTRGAVVSMRHPALVHPVHVRMFPSSDDFVFDQILIAGEHEPLCQMEKPRFILDLGANVGYASALFASMYPEAHILAVEPDSRNYQVCVENLQPYGARVQTLMGAVWSRRSQLAVSRGQFGDGRDWAVQVREPSDPGLASDVVPDQQHLVDAWDVGSLLELAGEQVIDLVKIDIEGSEAAIFASNTGWLAHVRNICIELHGDGCREIFFQALRGYDYRKIEHGEKVFCLNLRRASNL